MTWREMLETGAHALKNAGVEEYETDARELLLHATGMTLTQYLMMQDQELPAMTGKSPAIEDGTGQGTGQGTGKETKEGTGKRTERIHGKDGAKDQGGAQETEDNSEKYMKLIGERARRVPLQHLTGEQWFMGYPFRVTQDVLIPRVDTEALVETVLEVCAHPGSNTSPASKLTGLVETVPEVCAHPGSNTSPASKLNGSVEPVPEACAHPNSQAGLAATDETARCGSEKHRYRLLDLCTGSGCIAISLALLGRFSYVAATDLSEAALALARENARKLLGGARSGGERQGCRDNQSGGVVIEFFRGDLFEALSCERGQMATPADPMVCVVEEMLLQGTDGWMPGADSYRRNGCRFDVIVSNPPYIPDGEIDALMPEVRDHEPWGALRGGGDGLDFYRRIAAGAGHYMKDGGRIFLEIGDGQAGAVMGLLGRAGFSEISMKRDLSGRERVVFARWMCT
ncbi:MAG: peptide chain release factor N(5)-glutamine methyltransferase [Lachnospiraceae bacterium]|jgi:methylase of polypeptide subunit release factors|nr:peptide chain release factor N(5)-glutamine methyltransferase [Lachnospiraceae bacterium]